MTQEEKLDLFRNKIVNMCFASWFAAQFIKVILHYITDKEIDFSYMNKSGGMPSSHSSIVCTLAVCIGKHFGFTSPFYAIAFVFGSIVMYDATGVRRATGEQAKALNQIIDFIRLKEEVKNGEFQFQAKLKEVLGHKPLEVLAGSILGIVIGCFY